MKKILITFVAFMLPMMASAYSRQIDGIYYDFNYTTNVATVTYMGTEKDKWGEKYYVSNYSGSVVIPSKVDAYSVGAIGEYAFYNCTELTSVTIPNSLKTIGKYAFYCCSSLSSITIPNGVTSIGDYAFVKCSGLTSITIPSSVTSISDYVFGGCAGLTSIVVEEGNTKFYSDGNAIIEYASKKLILGCKSTVISDDVTSIGNRAFLGCKDLESIPIPLNLISIGNSAFASCSGLETITIPDKVTSIGENAFYNCSGLTSFTIGSSVTSIGINAFSSCNNLTQLYCKAKEVPKVTSADTRISSDAFTGIDKGNITLYVPEESMDAYNSDSHWSGFKVILPLTDDRQDNGQQVETCATPTITFEKGEFVFNCETEGVTFHYEISRNSSGSTTGNSSGIANKVTAYNPTSVTISVYATKPGYYNSETATATYTGKFGDLNGDGNVNVGDHVELTKIIMEQ